jgi:uroporphyrinogen-III synthase
VRLLLTRPEPDARRTAAALRARGHAVVIAPLMHIEAIADTPVGNGPWGAILITSANAAQAIAAHGRHRELCAVPVFAVGTRSTQAMRMAGFADVTSADGDVNDLADLIAARIKPGAPLLYLAGGDRAGDLAADLQTRGFRVHTAVVYRAVAASTLPATVAEALAGDIDGVLHFSRRSAQAYVDAAANAGLLAIALKPAHYCLSAQVAEPLAAAGAAIIRIAPEPAEAALIAHIGAELT